MREEIGGETLLSYSEAVLYALEIIDGETLLIKTQPVDDQITQFDVPFRDNIEDEFTLEGMLDIAVGLVELSSRVDSLKELNFYGYSMIEVGALSENQTLYSIFPVEQLDEFLEEAGDQTEKEVFMAEVQSSSAYKRHILQSRYYKLIPDIFSPESLMMSVKSNLGCEITTGMGCAIPEGCDLASGEGCEFTSGCNIITREGCAIPLQNCVVYTNCSQESCVIKPVIQTFCKPRVRTYCNPEITGDCDQYLDTSLPLELVQDPVQAGQPLVDPTQPQSLRKFYNPDFWGVYDDWDDEDESNGAPVPPRCRPVGPLLRPG